MTIHCDKHVGLDGGYHVEEINNSHGQHYFKATYQPTHMFGMSVEAAPLFGYGATKELAVQRLEKEISEFNDAMWV